MITTLIFLAVLSVLVLVHEFGHFWTAKKMGMKVEEFGIGFPPRAWSVKKKDTVYSINWLPLGGFVKIKGEDGQNRNDPDSFAAKKPWQKFIVLAAGVAMNFILAAAILSVGYIIGLPQAIDGLDQGMVRDRKVQLIQILPESPAQRAGLQIGDAVKTFNGEEILTVERLISLANKSVGQTAVLEIVRDGKIMEKEIPVELMPQTGKGGIGVALIGTGIVSYPFHSAIWHGFKSTALLTGQVINGFYQMLKSIAIGQGAGVEVSGPVGIAVLTGEVSRLGFVYLLQFAALLSINLAVINFLPFPALDGGRAIFVLIEKIRRKQIDQKIEGVVHALGFSLLMILIIIVTFKDILRFIK